MFFIYSCIVARSMEGYDEQLFSCADLLTFWSMLYLPVTAALVIQSCASEPMDSLKRDPNAKHKSVS